MYNPFWRVIDGVQMINLDRRKDRLKQFMADAQDVIPPEKLHRVSAIWGCDLPGFGEPPWFRGRRRDQTWAGRAGCILSHRRALLAAREAGMNTVLILEDDAVIESTLNDIGENLHNALQQIDKEWDICYLGFTEPRAPFEKITSLGSDHILYRVFGCNSGHAYILKEHIRDWILQQLPDERDIWRWLSHHRAIDRWYLRTLGRHFRVVCVSPNVANQRPGHSDIVGREMLYVGDHHALRQCQHKRSPTYSRRLALVSASSRCTEAYDRARGVVKQIRGF